MRELTNSCKDSACKNKILNLLYCPLSLLHYSNHTAHSHTCQLPHLWDILVLKSRFVIPGMLLNSFIQFTHFTHFFILQIFYYCYWLLLLHCPLIFEVMPPIITMIFATQFRSQRLRGYEIWVNLSKTTEMFQKWNFLLTFLHQPFFMLVMWHNHVIIIVTDSSSEDRVVCTGILRGQLNM